MKKCPFFKKKCIKDKCMFWTQLLGKDPQTGEVINDCNCSIAFLPILLVENAKNISHVQSAIEAFRNKSIVFQDILLSALQANQKQTIGSKEED